MIFKNLEEASAYKSMERALDSAKKELGKDFSSACRIEAECYSRILASLISNRPQNVENAND